MATDRRLLHEAQQIEAEILRRKQAKRLSDPVEFATSIGKTPDPWQARVLRSQSRRILLNCSRQAGKSLITAVAALHRALAKPGALVLIVSPSQRQSSEMLVKVKEGLRAMPSPVAPDEDNKLSISFMNDARIVSLPANEGTIRGFSAVELLIEDEAADVPDELHNAIRPMLAISGGQLMLLGTPKGRRGHFFEAWENGGEAWERIKVTAKEIPRYTPGFLEEERADMHRRGLGDWFRQEYECEFVNAAAGRVYGGYDAERNVVDALPRTVRESDWTYLCGLDFGISDENAVTVLGWRKHDPCVYIIESYRMQAIPSVMAQEVGRIDQKYHFARIVGDVGGMGKAFAEEARARYHVPIEAAEKHNKVGYISLFNGDLHTGRIKVLRSTCRDLISEWMELPWAEGAKKEAEGFNNHCADSALYSWRAANAYVESSRRLVIPGSDEWRQKEQADLLTRDLEAVERSRGIEWWEGLT